jgi:hypothetical protein
MATYNEWNEALVKYFTAGVSKGSEVYLSVDTDELRAIASSFLTKPAPGKPEDDFVEAIRERCVDSVGRRVRIGSLRVKDAFGVPEAVAFLAVMVLSANRMREQLGDKVPIGEGNYFIRLRQILGLRGSGRPTGMPRGMQGEEGLWMLWNDWLVERGWQPTAQGGEAARKYTNYPLSQTILRDSERDYLEKIFRDAYAKRQISRFMDSEQTGVYLRRFEFPTRPRLCQEFHSTDAARRGTFCESAFSVYESIDWDAREPDKQGRRVSQRSLQAGLLRRVTAAEGIAYWLLPRQLSHYGGQAMEVENPSGQWHKLEQQREGYFFPPWVIQTIFIDDARRYKCRGDPVIKDMVFPARNFWVLVQDPEDPIAGEWGTWAEHNEVGEELLILVRNDPQGKPFHELMKLLEKYDLIKWSERADSGGWTEYRNCVVQCYELETVQPPDAAALLWDRLKPSHRASIRLTGGLPVRNPSGWLQGALPTIEVVGFVAGLSCRLSGNGHIIYEQSMESGMELPLDPDLAPGHYEVEVRYEDQVEARKRFYVVGDQELQPSEGAGSVATRVVGCSSVFALGGAVIEEPAE